MRKISQVSRLVEYLHCGVVLGCVGITLLGTMNLGMCVYNYYSTIRPQRDMEAERQSLKETETSAAETNCMILLCLLRLRKHTSNFN